MTSQYAGRQIVVQGDGMLAVMGIFKCAAGFVAALLVGAWLHAWMTAVFAIGAVLLLRGLYWPTLLALIGAAYADLPARAAWDVELSSYPLMGVQALVAVPLWLAAMDYPEKLQGRARRAAWACCAAGLVAGLAAPWLDDGAYWLVVAPLAVGAIGVLLVRMRRYRVPFGTRGWVCCGAMAPAALVVCFEMFLPSSYPVLQRVALWANLWLSLGPVVLIVLNTGGTSHDRKIRRTDPLLGRLARRVLGQPRDPGSRRARVVRYLLHPFGAAVRGASSVLHVGHAGRGAEASIHGRVRAFPAVGDGRGSRRGASGDGASDGRHDPLRPAPREIDDAGRLIPQERAG